ncbi:hypothetical protein B0T24DRAFT_643690, partial [Lasiosphaeria ovina]
PKCRLHRRRHEPISWSDDVGSHSPPAKRKRLNIGPDVDPIYHANARQLEPLPSPPFLGHAAAAAAPSAASAQARRHVFYGGSSRCNITRDCFDPNNALRVLLVNKRFLFIGAQCSSELNTFAVDGQVSRR